MHVDVIMHVTNVTSPARLLLSTPLTLANATSKATPKGPLMAYYSSSPVKTTDGDTTGAHRSLSASRMLSYSGSNSSRRAFATSLPSSTSSTTSSSYEHLTFSHRQSIESKGRRADVDYGHAIMADAGRTSTSNLNALQSKRANDRSTHPPQRVHSYERYRDTIDQSSSPRHVSHDLRRQSYSEYSSSAYLIPPSSPPSYAKRLYYSHPTLASPPPSSSPERQVDHQRARWYSIDPDDELPPPSTSDVDYEHGGVGDVRDDRVTGELHLIPQFRPALFRLAAVSRAILASLCPLHPTTASYSGDTPSSPPDVSYVHFHILRLVCPRLSAVPDLPRASCVL
ncbi:hypothetical protein BC835DRAFT_616245 [Cytidiella melzeri]|nr:hypothetical protein BC835DRAFT_616245 [Cytidiella melzeri]